MNLWQRKLLAFLHDPPHKALDIPGHEEARDTFIRQAGFADASLIREADKIADWTGAAADRSLWMSSGLRSPFGGAEHPFLHPMGGSELPVAVPPTPEILAETLQTIQHYAQSLENIPVEDRDRVNFFLHWRRWAVDAAKIDARCLYQPADTRIPDHSIWQHNGIVSALQGCVDESGSLRPAFLLFQLGPVQEFIAQARSTRDLWSGSYLLSWLVAHAIKAVTDAVGPDSVVFPFLRAQPLYDLLHRDEIYRKVPYQGKDGRQETLWDRMKAHEREMLIPNLPNRFLALVPAGRAAELGAAAEKAVRNELAKVGDAIWSWMVSHMGATPEWRGRYDAQVLAFPQLSWQASPWTENADEAIAELARHDPPAARGIEALRRLSSGQPNTGFAWPAHYAHVDRALAARRNLRDFQAWPRDEHSSGAVKDSMSGREEAMGGEAWWNAIRESTDERVRRLFRSSDRLGAVNLVKRI
ncbi:MAG: type III-B CRISPR-associated protein Cas10/Cmr2 [Verrucomicrobia bacterium A1]|nr:MAG: type III-B CRISPR-associated protein Cas10/Cmr2 [Verrucomicrobia bacterium A1]